MKQVRPTTVSRDKAMKQADKSGSVQQQFVQARAVHDHVLCLTSASGTREYLNVLQVDGMSYDLKSEDEQQVITDLYQSFLCALSYPLQILWRVQPLKLADYLAQFAVDDATDETGIWQSLAHSHRAFLEQLAAQRTLLDRKIYLVVRVGITEAVTTSPIQRFRFSHQKDRQRASEAESLERARQELDVRWNEITRLLTNMHVSVHRLAGKQELLPFYYASLSPRKAARFPLAGEHLESLDRPIQVAGYRKKGGKQHEAVTVSEEQERDNHPTDFARVEDLLAPSAIVISPDVVCIEDEYARAISVSHLPRIVSAGWLKPLAELDEPMDVSFHVQPLNSVQMLGQLRRRQMEYQSSRLMAQRKGNDLDPDLKIAEADVDRLIDRLASGEERLLNVSMIVLVRGASRQELDERTERVLSLLHTMLFKARVTLFEQEQAFRSCLPHGQNVLGQPILLDSHSASTMFPFLSNSLFHVNGVLEGITPQGDPIVLDAWGPEMANANRMILGPPGWGKSHHVKASILRLALKYWSLQQKSKSQQHTFQVLIVDPEREYGRMASVLDGQIIRLAPGSRQHVNPFDLPVVSPHNTYEHGDRLADHVQKLHSLLEIMLADHAPEQTGKLTSHEKGLLDRALYETYRRMGISSDIKTHDRPVPLMRDLYDVLESGVCGADPSGLTQRLRRYVHGSLAGVFAGPTNVALESSVIVFDIHDMETELRPIGLFLVSNFVWTHCFQSSIPRQLIVDEAATLYQYESGALFLEDLVRRARKHYLGVTIISQHPGLFRESAIPANCATHILMRQDATSLDLMEKMFKLSHREVQLLRRLGIGEALLTTSEKRLHVRFETSELEHILATTNPRELALWRDDPRYQHLETLIERLVRHDTVELDVLARDRSQQETVGEGV